MVEQAFQIWKNGKIGENRQNGTRCRTIRCIWTPLAKGKSEWRELGLLCSATNKNKKLIGFGSEKL